MCACICICICVNVDVNAYCLERKINICGVVQESKITVQSTTYFFLSSTLSGNIGSNKKIGSTLYGNERK